MGALTPSVMPTKLAWSYTSLLTVSFSRGIIAHIYTGQTENYPPARERKRAYVTPWPAVCQHHFAPYPSRLDMTTKRTNPPPRQETKFPETSGSYALKDIHRALHLVASSARINTSHCRDPPNRGNEISLPLRRAFRQGKVQQRTLLK